MSNAQTTPTEPDMMALAIAADRSADTPAEPATVPPPVEKQATTPTPAQTETTGNTADDTTKSAPDQKTPPHKDDKTAEAAGSPYAKAQKESARKDKSWQAIEAQKAAVRDEQAKIAAERQTLHRELAELRAKAQAPTAPAKDEHGNTAEDYDELADKYADEGNTALAKAARERAKALRRAPAGNQATGQQAATAPQTPDSPQFQAAWQANVQQLITKDPELAKPDNPIVRTANALVNDPDYGRFFRHAPDGIAAAVEVARIMQQAESAKTLTTEVEMTKAELTKAKAEIDRLNKLTQPQGSPPTGAAPSRKPTDALTDDDIRQMAAAADRGET